MKTFRRPKHHPLTVLKVREHRPGAPGAGCHKPCRRRKTSRPVHAGDLTVHVSQMRRLQTYTEKYDGAAQEGCRVYHCCRHTMVSKLKLDHNEVPRAFVQKYQRSVLPKSLRTHPDHTPHVVKFTLRSLTQVTVLHFVLRLSFYQTHDFFLNCLQSLIRQRFFCVVIFLAHEILQNHIVSGRKMKNFPGATVPGPPSFFRHHTNTPTSNATEPTVP